MKRMALFLSSLFALLVVALSTAAKAETYTASVLMWFDGVATFRPAGYVVVSGLGIHEGMVGHNGPVCINADFAPYSIILDTGTGEITSEERYDVDVAVLKRLLTNPTGYYLDLHTKAPYFPSGLSGAINVSQTSPGIFIRTAKFPFAFGISSGAA